MATHMGKLKSTSVLDFKTMVITSTSFGEGTLIPSRHTCDGENISPSLFIQRIPPETKCLAIIMDDPDAPRGIWVHWVNWNIPVTHHIEEGAKRGVQGLNDFRKNQYDGPCPPEDTHRYFFKVYALDSILQLPVKSGKEELLKAMAGHILGFGELMGRYERDKSL